MGFAGNLFDFTPCLGKVSPKGNRGYLNFSIGLRATRRIRQLDRIVPFLSLSVSLTLSLSDLFCVQPRFRFAAMPGQTKDRVASEPLRVRVRV